MFEQFICANHLLWSNPLLTSSLSTPSIHAPSPQLLFPTLTCSSWNPLSPLGAASVYMGLEVTLWYMDSLSHGSFDSIAVWLLPLAARHRSVWTCWDILFSLNWIIESLILTKTFVFLKHGNFYYDECTHISVLEKASLLEYLQYQINQLFTYCLHV